MIGQYGGSTAVRTLYLTLHNTDMLSFRHSIVNNLCLIMNLSEKNTIDKFLATVIEAVEVVQPPHRANHFLLLVAVINIQIFCEST